MLDGLFKERQDRFWDRVARPLAGTGLTPNHVTVASVALVAFFSAGYTIHKSSLAYGLSLGCAELLDNVDGALARVTKRASKFGSYLDATTDRYKELFAFAAVGHVTGEWAICLFAVAGSMLTSYNKARAGMEIPISNTRWPDLFERFERILVLVLALVLDTLLSPTVLFGKRALFGGLVVIAVMSLLSSVQRLFRARELMSAPSLSGGGTLSDPPRSS
ncbi:MAG TPA: CDP-alcohol phosphatidyltransferase family protein [Labilithrix sp.]|nr:CDP-alcohol phosphatidyltransferase family protein [Labilithrix sp.]